MYYNYCSFTGYWLQVLLVFFWSQQDLGSWIWFEWDISWNRLVLSYNIMQKNDISEACHLNIQMNCTCNAHVDLIVIREIDFMTKMFKCDILWLLWIYKCSFNEYFLILCIYFLFSLIYIHIHYHSNEIFSINYMEIKDWCLRYILVPSLFFYL